MATSGLPRISVSAKAAVWHDGRILLLSYDDGTFHYNLPGGKGREGEPLRETAARKVLEETGLRVRVTRLLFVVEYVPALYDGEFGDVHKTQHNFLAELVDDNTEPRFSEPRDPMQVGFEWVPLSDLTSKPLLPRVTRQLVERIRESSDVLVDRW